MKIEIGKDFPRYFKSAYPEEFDLFSHFEVTAGVTAMVTGQVQHIAVEES